MRRGWGQPAKLRFAGHALMENRSGLCADLQITDARLAEPKAAQALLSRQRRRRIRPVSIGADKGYRSKAFVVHLREHGIRPDIARIASRRIPSWMRAALGMTAIDKVSASESESVSRRSSGGSKRSPAFARPDSSASSALSCMPASLPVLTISCECRG